MTDGFDYVRGATVSENTNHSDISNVGFDGVIFLIDVTASAASAPQFIIQGKDRLSGTYYTLLDSGNVSADVPGFIVLEIHPALTEVTDVRTSRLLPDELRLRVVADDAITYTVRVIQI